MIPETSRDIVSLSLSCLSGLLVATQRYMYRQIMCTAYQYPVFNEESQWISSRAKDEKLAQARAEEARRAWVAAEIWGARLRVL